MNHTEAKHHNREDIEGFSGEDAPWVWGLIATMVIVLALLGLGVTLMF